MAGERGTRPDTHTENERGNTVADMTKVRTTFTPGTVIEVDERELLDLDRQHLIHSREGDEGWQDDEPVESDSGVITDGLDEQATTGDAGRLADNKAEAPASVDDKPIESLAERVERVSAKGSSKGGK